VGHDERKKGLQHLLDAMLLLPDRWELMLVGKACSKPAVKRWIEERGLTQRVHAVGVLSDVGLAYLACCVLVHPTLEDTFGMVVAEAMAFARAVVVSASGYCGVSQELENAHHAMLLESPQDPIALAHAIEMAVQNAKSLGQAAWAWTQERSWQKKALLLDGIYRSVVERK
jgi:UDP-glucose:(heptosyl)LPS alpha-1,3-glucosyltransferase